MEFEFKLVDNESEILQIKELHEANLINNISNEEANLEGFLTTVYTLEFLNKMHSFHPSVIAKHGGMVVGYALVTTRDIKGEHDDLSQFLSIVDGITINGVPMSTKNYVVVGQLCIAKGYRGMGLVQSLYQYFHLRLSSRFECAVTDVANDNPRSIKAHSKSGFIPISNIDYDGKSFTIILWDWSKINNNERINF